MKTISLNVVHCFFIISGIFSLCLNLSFAQGTPTITAIPTPTVTATTTVTATPTPIVDPIACVVVSSSDYTPIEGATITIEPGGYSATTGPDGSYTIANLPAGDYIITASAEGFESSSQPIVVVAGESISCANFSLVPIYEPTPEPICDSYCKIKGYITDAKTNEGIRGATVEIKGTGESAITDENGYYEWEDYSFFPCSDSGTDYYITISANKYSTVYDEVSPKNCGDDYFNYSLEPQTVLTGYIKDLNGNPIESVKIILKGMKSKYKGKAVSDAEGYFEFTDIKKGKYFIYVSKKGYKKHKKKVELKEGETKGMEVILKDK